jgi:hypothetical protein
MIKKELLLLENKIKEFKKDGITDPFDLEMKILIDMPEFYDQYPSIVKRLCKGNLDNEYLYKMINLLEEINKGEKTLESVEYNLGEELAEKFLYPVIKKQKLN